jgi:hypothetical protein
MLNLPPEIMTILNEFAPLFSDRVWVWAQVLAIGAILTPNRRTVTACLRIMGLGQDRWFQNYHRVLNRAQWSSLDVSRVLLRLLVTAFVPADEAVVVAADETLERRRGPKISGISCFRDAARSSRTNKVKSFGLRWVNMALLVPVPWSMRVWALPFLTVLAPSKATDEAEGRRHKSSIDWVMQMITQVHRWLPDRQLVLVVDGALAAYKLALRCVALDGAVTFVTRLQWNARLFEPPPPHQPGQRGRTRLVGDRQSKPQDWLADPHTPWRRCVVPWYNGQRRTVDLISRVALWYTYGVPPVMGRWVIVRDPSGALEPCVFFATDPNATPEQIIAWYVMRWSQETTFEEVRAHLGFETQRQWNPLAVARTSPALLGLFSFVTLLAHRLTIPDTLPVRSTAWYAKPTATFSDVLAYVRSYLWSHPDFPRTVPDPCSVKIPAPLFDIWIEALSYAA